MAVYAGDRADFFARALASATTDQLRPPDHVVIVRDGPVVPAVADLLDEVATRPRTTVVPLERNGGLARALNIGLEHCATDIVARADADDICLPNRFAVQIPLISAGADIVGSAIDEFDDDPTTVDHIREVATDPEVIAQQARFETPFNHPSVVYRKSAVIAAGGYPDLPLMEDYLLWGKMLLSGARAANVDDVLVHYRVGAGAYARRGGWRLFRSEIALQRAFKRIGFTTWPQCLRNLVVRGGYRLIPEPLRRIGYHARLVVRQRRFHHDAGQ
ncbi:MAG: glycosyltransferase [Propionibacteriaceae bacterium]|jgi:glycosyltransferase involved in cell wall biosynthesis|nr:glycosyltransferase [Propionibacteriaceae bacterium]